MKDKKYVVGGGDSSFMSLVTVCLYGAFFWMVINTIDTALSCYIKYTILIGMN